jgi:hypothetical protein
MRYQVMEKPELVGVKELAKELGLDRGTVATWNHQGRLPQPDYILGGNPIWFKERVLSLIKENAWIVSRLEVSI